DAAMDVDVLRPARRPLLGKRGNEAKNLHVATVTAHVNQIAAFAIQLIQAIAKTGDWRTLQDLPAGTGECEADFRIAERELRHDPRHLRRLCGIRFQKLPPGG